MLKLSTPQINKKGDVTFFSTGIRFSNDFIEREGLEKARYLWVFLDEPYMAFSFLETYKPHSVKLTESSKNTSGKTASCAYLKQHHWIAIVMESENLNDRKFTLIKTNEETELGTIAKHKINLYENNVGIPF